MSDCTPFDGVLEALERLRASRPAAESRPAVRWPQATASDALPEALDHTPGELAAKAPDAVRRLLALAHADGPVDAAAGRGVMAPTDWRW